MDMVKPPQVGKMGVPVNHGDKTGIADMLESSSNSLWRCYVDHGQKSNRCIEKMVQAKPANARDPRCALHHGACSAGDPVFKVAAGRPVCFNGNFFAVELGRGAPMTCSSGWNKPKPSWFATGPAGIRRGGAKADK